MNSLQWVDTYDVAEPGGGIDTDHPVDAAELIHMNAICLAGRPVAPQVRKTLKQDYVHSKAWAPSYAIIVYTFEHLSSRDALLEFLGKTHIIFWNKGFDMVREGDPELQHELGHEFLLSVMKRMAEPRNAEHYEYPRHSFDPTHYYIHDKQEVLVIWTNRNLNCIYRGDLSQTTGTNERACISSV